MAEVLVEIIWIGLFVAAIICALRAIDSAWKAGYCKGREDEANLSDIHPKIFTGSRQDRQINEMYATKRALRDLPQGQSPG